MRFTRLITTDTVGRGKFIIVWIATIAGLIYGGCASGGSTIDVDVDDAAIACGDQELGQPECDQEVKDDR